MTAPGPVLQGAGVEEQRPWERILSVPSPQSASNVVDNAPMVQRFSVIRPQQQMLQPAPTWHADQGPSSRAWHCNSQQYGPSQSQLQPQTQAQPVFHMDDLSGRGMLLHVPPPAAPHELAALACSGMMAAGMTGPTGGVTGCSSMTLVPTIPAAPDCSALVVHMQNSGDVLENARLDTLLQHLAADVYQD